VHEWRFLAVATRSLEEVQRTGGVRVEIVERNSGRALVRRLRGRMHDHIRPHGLDEIQDRLAIADIVVVVNEPRECPFEAALIPPSVARLSEENGALIVVDAVHVEVVREICADCRSDETRGTGDETVRHGSQTRIIRRGRPSGRPTTFTAVAWSADLKPGGPT
jgi:hypothetical protein